MKNSRVAVRANQFVPLTIAKRINDSCFQAAHLPIRIRSKDHISPQSVPCRRAASENSVVSTSLGKLMSFAAILATSTGPENPRIDQSYRTCARELPEEPSFFYLMQNPGLWIGARMTEVFGGSNRPLAREIQIPFCIVIFKAARSPHLSCMAALGEPIQPPIYRHIQYFSAWGLRSSGLALFGA
jgi:hypothetical protein